MKISKNSRRDFLKTFALGAASMSIPRSEWIGPLLNSETGRFNKPNIIFILADDLGYGDLSCYGATKVKTPQIDRIASEGIRFTDAHSPSSVCSPSRYGLLTGRYGWRTRLQSWVCRPNDPLLIDTKRLTVASLLKKEGYATGCIGKWHLGFGDTRPDWTYGELKPGPLEIGFDYYFGVPTSNNWPPYVYVENHRVFSHPEYDVWVPSHRRDEDIAKTLTAKAVKFIEQSKDQSFFLYFPTCNIHFPLTPHKQFYDSSDCGVRCDFIVELDWSVGEILKTLDRLNLTNNTLLVFSSDNGGIPTDEKYGHKSNGELRGQKAQIYEAGHRVPYVARWPGQIKPRSTSDELICLTDFMALCSAVLGVELPSDAAEDSYNILPALRGEKLSHPIREALVHHSVDGTFAIRQGDWKLILGTGDGGWPPDKSPVKLRSGEPAGQLYNLRLDPSEANNLYLESPEIVYRLSKLLEKYKKQGHSHPSCFNVF